MDPSPFQPPSLNILVAMADLIPLSNWTSCENLDVIHRQVDRVSNALQWH